MIVTKVNVVDNNTLQISLASNGLTGTADRVFVNLTQPVENGSDKTASMYDIVQMIGRARSGLSATSYKKNNCPAGITEQGINVRLDFTAWPSSPSLPYTLTASIGEISLPTINSEYTEFSIIFDHSDAVELDFILAELTGIPKWETPCFSQDGTYVHGVNVYLDGNSTIRAEYPITGTLRVKGRKWGADHKVTHKLIKSLPIRPDEPIPEEGINAEDIESYWAYTDVATWNGDPVDSDDYIDASGLSIDNLNITITAIWMDKGEEKTNSIRLNIPQCVKDLLSMCNGDVESGTHSGTSICDLSDRDTHLTVYESGCTGNIIEKRLTKEDPDSWCE